MLVICPEYHLMFRNAVDCHEICVACLNGIPFGAQLLKNNIQILHVGYADWNIGVVRIFCNVYPGLVCGKIFSIPVEADGIEACLLYTSPSPRD